MLYVTCRGPRLMPLNDNISEVSLNHLLVVNTLGQRRGPACGGAVDCLEGLWRNQKRLVPNTTEQYRSKRQLKVNPGAMKRQGRKRTKGVPSHILRFARSLHFVVGL
ncbi:unnamed protein product [Boreogadus saida]